MFMEAEVAYYLPDKENRSEKITSEEFYGKFGMFHGKELEKKMSIQQANQVSIPNNSKMKFKEVEEMRRMLDPDKLISHLSNLVKGDSKELEERKLEVKELEEEFMKAEEANRLPDKSEETTSEETKGELVVMKPASSEGQQYTERETMEVLEKSVITKEVSGLSTSEENSKGVSVFKAARH